MSTSGTDLPSDTRIAKCLRNIVARLWKKQNLEDLTVRRVRLAAEDELDLPAGHLKSETWNQKSKDIISAEVAKQEAAAEDTKSASEDTTTVSEKAAAENKSMKTKGPTKRASADTTLPSAKRRKSQPHRRSEDTQAASESEGKAGGDSSESDANSKTQDNTTQTPARPKAADIRPGAGDDGDESDMSSLIDDDPAPRKKQNKHTSKSAKLVKSNSKTTSKPNSSAPNTDLSPSETEIKTLQSWLVKCGIRKLWHRELADYAPDDHAGKIAHLKRMLADAGMTGRYSVEKARQVKERRELAADLEAVTEGNKRWGQSDGEEDEGGEARGGRPGRRRLARGLQDLGAFLDDGEETD